MSDEEANTRVNCDLWYTLSYYMFQFNSRKEGRDRYSDLQAI